MILAIDPGPKQSAFMAYDNGTPVIFGKLDNDYILVVASEWKASGATVVIEMIASYGMAVGAEVFETCVWIGRFIEAVKGAERVFRKDVKLHLCGTTKAKDANIRQALIDRYGPGKDVALGKKASPGPLFGISNDVWAALAVAVTYDDKLKANAKQAL